MAAESSYYADPGPTRAEVDALTGPAVLEFGANWCGICQAARPIIAEALGAYPDLKHVKVEDGPGKPLGRSFRIKLWPTLILLNDGREVARIVRPGTAEEIRQELAMIGSAGDQKG